MWSNLDDENTSLAVKFITDSSRFKVSSGFGLSTGYLVMCIMKRFNNLNDRLQLNVLFVDDLS